MRKREKIEREHEHGGRRKKKSWRYKIIFTKETNEAEEWGVGGRGMLSRKMLSRSCNSYAEKKQLPQNLSTDYMN